MLGLVGIADSLSAAGQATQPAAGAAIATIAAPGAGTYRVDVTCLQAGTVDSANLADLELRHGATVVGKVPSAAVGLPVTFPRVVVLAGEAISVNATAQPAAASVMVAALVATRIG